MKIVKAFPPNYSEIIAAIPAVKLQQTIIFTYGDTIYCPAGNTDLPHHLIAHEATHSAEQAKIGADVWWSRYLVDARFRLEQELLAYRAQYQRLASYNRQQRKSVLQKITRDLSGAMYGRIIDKDHAKKLITGEVEL